MDGMLRRCFLMSIGAFALTGVLLAAGVPGAVLLGVAPLAICLGMHLLMGHGDGHGQYPWANVQDDGGPHEVHANMADPTGATR